MAKYSFESLNEDDFETMIVDLSKKLFGAGIHAFAAGRDSGRDAYFNGTAERFPSTASPWYGHIIIQAKHTSSTGASCSDNEFSENKTSVLKKEIRRIQEIMKSEHLDGYLLITNRKITGGTHQKIIKLLTEELKISQVDILGLEDLEKLIDDYPYFIKKYRLTRFQVPDVFYEKDIRDVINMFKHKTNWVSTPPIREDDSLDYINKEKKNALNNIDTAYFSEIKEHSLKHFANIDKFLHDPINAVFLENFLNTTADLRSYVEVHRDAYPFKDILETIIKNIIGDEVGTDIFRARALVRVFVHYMYWSCDLGRKD